MHSFEHVDNSYNSNFNTFQYGIVLLASGTFFENLPGARRLLPQQPGNGAHARDAECEDPRHDGLLDMLLVALIFSLKHTNINVISRRIFFLALPSAGLLV